MVIRIVDGNGLSDTNNSPVDEKVVKLVSYLTHLLATMEIERNWL
uniref:Uncharacterized protein n=1 Tax=Rhizophora mucronata TaxID=61149 RepID=A0A2P2JQM9_RHIMU